MSWSLLLQMGGGFSYAFVGPFFGLLVMGAVVFLLWRLLVTSTSGTGREPDDPMETLRKRYARGDIDDEEFERQARLLRER